MPMDFPDMDSLIRCAKARGFRDPNVNEIEQEYRNALADFVEDLDFLESWEIRNKMCWDKWSNETVIQMFRKAGIKEFDPE